MDNKLERELLLKERAALRQALSDCIELLTANQSTTTRAGLDADMVIDNAHRALKEGK